jgi:hypothetical protein
MTFAPLVEHVPNLIIEEFGILAGPPKAGKSWLANGLALACAQGGTALGAIDVEHRRVLLLALEDGQRRLKERLSRAVRRLGSGHETVSDITPEFLAGVFEWTGVPVNMLSGDTIPAVWDSAQRVVDWKQATTQPSAPSAATSAVPVPQVEQVSRQVMYPHQTADDWLTAWRSGRLGRLGAPAPPPRRNGEAHRNAAP